MNLTLKSSALKQSKGESLASASTNNASKSLPTWKQNKYPNPLLTPPGAYLFQTRLRGELIKTGAYLRGGGLFYLAKMVFQEEPEYRVKNLKHKKLKVM